MPFSPTFYSLAEKTPNHGENIYYFDSTINNFDFQNGGISETCVEYYWDEIDPEDDDYTGNQIIYDAVSNVPENCRLCFSIGDEGFVFDEDEPLKHNVYWMNSEEFWKVFPESKPLY